MSKPFSDCQENLDSIIKSDLFKWIERSLYHYTQKLCFNYCYEKQIIEQCNCSTKDYLSFFNATSCQKTQNKCADKIFDEDNLSIKTKIAKEAFP